MSNTNPDSSNDQDMEENLEQAANGTEELSQEEIDAATLDALSDAAEQPAEEELSLEEQQIAEIADLKEKLLRAMAETENMRRRSQKEKEDAHNFAISKFARDILNVSDNLRRAIDAVSAEDKENDVVKNILTGVEMTESELLSTLGKHKVEMVEAEGQKFDPNFHQAMFEIENPDVEPGTILQVMQPGYIIAGRLLRPALVGVAKGGQKKADVKVDQSV